MRLLDLSLERVNICRRHGFSAGAASRDQVSDRYASVQAFLDTSLLRTTTGEAHKTITEPRWESDRFGFESIRYLPRPGKVIPI